MKDLIDRYENSQELMRVLVKRVPHKILKRYLTIIQGKKNATISKTSMQNSYPQIAIDLW